MKIGLDSECSVFACFIYCGLCSAWVFQVALVVKNLPASAEVRDVSSIPSWKDPLEEGMATHSVSLPGESHGQRSFVGYPCLENPMDRGALWATVHGVSESGATETTEHTCTTQCSAQRSAWHMSGRHSETLFILCLWNAS